MQIEITTLDQTSAGSAELPELGKLELQAEAAD